MSALPKAILFDLDDTILAFGNRELLLIEVAEEFGEVLGSFAPVEFGKLLEAAFREFWADVALNNALRSTPRLLEARTLILEGAFARFSLPSLSPEVARRFAARFHELREAGEGRLFPRAVETLAELCRRGVLLALVTNGAAAIQRAKIERFDLDGFFRHVQIEGEVGFGKPHERSYLHAMAALGVEPDETWMVGDNLEWEVAAPQRLGIYAVWHDPLGQGLPADSPVVPDRIIRSISELLPDSSQSTRAARGRG